MSIDFTVSMSRLQPGDHWGYLSFTFPAFRHALAALDDASVVAWGASSASGQPVALVLGQVQANTEPRRVMELKSVFVSHAARRQGLATRLLQAWADDCRDQEFQELQATYMTGQTFTPAVEALLSRTAWSAPELRMLVIKATLDSIRSAPWMRSFRLQAGMEMVPWQSLSESDRRDIETSNQDDPWIPNDLYPFYHEQNAEPVTSLALKVGGQVKGWVINHRVDNVLRFTCSYMHPRLQRMGRILLLYNQAVAFMPQAGFDTGMWTVPAWHEGMAAFAKRWMAPYAVQFDETRGCRRML